MITLILRLALVGFLVYCIETYIPMPQILKTGIYVIVAFCVILYLMSVFGIADLPLPRVR